VTDEQREAYAQWLDAAEKGPTPPLSEYLRWERYDPNVPWRLGAGHLVNLLDQAVEALDEQELALNFEVTCLQCARTLEMSLRDKNRADRLHEKLEEIARITSPAWLAARPLPRMIGAEEMAQVAAIKEILTRG
jgi:hypothetical protein